MIRMASVEQALGLIAEHGARRVTGLESVPLAAALGRRLAEPVLARVSQPPAAVSAMDGYAVRFADMKLGASLRVVGESRAGTPFGGQVASGAKVVKVRGQLFSIYIFIVQPGIAEGKNPAFTV